MDALEIFGVLNIFLLCNVGQDPEEIKKSFETWHANKAASFFAADDDVDDAFVEEQEVDDLEFDELDACGPEEGKFIQEIDLEDFEDDGGLSDSHKLMCLEDRSKIQEELLSQQNAANLEPEGEACEAESGEVQDSCTDPPPTFAEIFGKLS